MGPTAFKVSIIQIGRNERNFFMVQLGVGIWNPFFIDFVQIAQETEKMWFPNKPIELMKEMFRMTLKAILCTSLGNIFEDNGGIEWLANLYHLCKCEMDHRILDVPPPNSQQEFSRKSKAVEVMLETNGAGS